MKINDRCHAIDSVGRAWWRHQMETFSALLAICAGNSPVTGEFPAQRPVTRSFDVFFDLRLNKRLNKQSRGWWFETLSRPLWRHRNGLAIFQHVWSLQFISLFVNAWHRMSYISYTPCNVSSMMTSSNGNVFRVTGQGRRPLMFSLICASINSWVNNREAGELRRHRAYHDVIVMQ